MVVGKIGIASVGFSCMASFARSPLAGMDDNDDDKERVSTGDVPWMLDAFRGSDAFIGLIAKFVNCFLDDLCEQVEAGAWLADGAAFGADVCVKLAKVIIERAS